MTSFDVRGWPATSTSRSAVGRPHRIVGSGNRGASTFAGFYAALLERGEARWFVRRTIDCGAPGAARSLDGEYRRLPEPRRTPEYISALLGLGVMVGVAASAYLVPDVELRHTILCLLAAVPAVAAMHSRPGVVVGFLIAAFIVVAGYSAIDTTSDPARFALLGVSALVIAFPTAIVVGLRRSLERALRVQEQASNTDPLTGLLNRRGLVVRTERIRELAASCGIGLGLLVLDVDHFKGVNDRLGHAVGDAVLRATAEMIDAHCSTPSVTARVGGEEFAVLMPAENLRAVLATAESIRAAIARAGVVTVSIGAVFDAESAPAGIGDDADAARFIDRLARAADTNLYVAKQAGRNRVRCAGLSGTDDGS